ARARSPRRSHVPEERERMLGPHAPTSVATSGEATRPLEQPRADQPPTTSAVERAPEAAFVVRRSVGYEAVKRLFDIIFSALAVIVLAPVLLALALAVKLGGGPILYRREVIGRHGRHFHALKFRTMMPHAEEYLAAHPELL